MQAETTLPVSAPLSPQMQAVLAALTPPAERQRSWRRQFDERVATALSNQLRVDDRRHIQIAAQAMGWELFGEELNPLPEPLILHPSKMNAGEIVIGSSEFPIMPLVEKHLHEVLEPVIRDRKQFFYENFSDITAAISSVIRSSPQYRILKALTVPLPGVEERDLTEMEIIHRQREVEADLRRRNVIPHSGRVLPGSAAHLALTAANRSIQMETIRQPARTVDPLAKARAWAQAQARSWGSKSGVDLGASVKIDVPDLSAPIGVKSETGDLYDLSAFASEWSRKLGNQAPARDTNFAGNLGYDFVRLIYATNPKDLGGALENLVHTHATRAAEKVCQDPRPALLELRRPRAHVYQDAPPYASGIPSGLLSNLDQASVVDLSTLQREQALTVGRVLHRSHFDTVPWLMTRQPLGASYPLLQDKRAYALVIEASELLLNDSEEPLVPGYRPMGHTGREWGFEQTADDPYANGGDLLIAPTELAELSDSYRKIGLNGLAAELGRPRERGVSAAQLADLIAANSDYTFDSSNELQVQGVANFAGLVKDGRLQVQCTGAAMFLAASLQQAIPGAIATVVHGNLITGEERISGIRHAQVLLSHRGRRYLLDSTPPAPAHSGLRPPRRNWRDRIRARKAQRRPRTGALPHPEPLDRQTAVLTPDTLATTKLANAATPPSPCPDHVVETIGNVLGFTHRSKIFEHARDTLGPADPIRRALEAAVNPKKDLAGTLSYLDKYVQANKFDRDRINAKQGIPSYSPELISLIADSLRATTKAPHP